LTFIFATLAPVAVCLPPPAQTASLRGKVIDESGAVIPGARVTLHGPAGLVRTATAGADGSTATTRATCGATASRNNRVFPVTSTAISSLRRSFLVNRGRSSSFQSVK
jgi:hypothetical protein